jgi:hypothetical protein
MQNLALHCQDEKYDPVAEKYRPEDRNVEYREESHHKSYHKSFCGSIPERSANTCYGYRARRMYYISETEKSSNPAFMIFSASDFTMDQSIHI